MIHHSDLDDAAVRKLIRQKKIQWAGNANLSIYGSLSCRSGKRMKRENRVFFSTTDDALAADFRPCSHCLPEQYKAWKQHRD